MAQPTTATVDQHWLSARDRSVIAILLVSTFVVILNETALNVALTSIMADLAVDERDVQWLTTAFLLTMAVVIPITGWLLERIPTRSAFLLALILFTTGTLICTVAPVFGLVLAGRLLPRLPCPTAERTLAYLDRHARTFARSRRFCSYSSRQCCTTC